MTADIQVVPPPAKLLKYNFDVGFADSNPEPVAYTGHEQNRLAVQELSSDTLGKTIKVRSASDTVRDALRRYNNLAIVHHLVAMKAKMLESRNDLIQKFELRPHFGNYNDISLGPIDVINYLKQSAELDIESTDYETALDKLALAVRADQVFGSSKGKQQRVSQLRDLMNKIAPKIV